MDIKLLFLVLAAFLFLSYMTDPLVPRFGSQPGPMPAATPSPTPPPVTIFQPQQRRLETKKAATRRCRCPQPVTLKVPANVKRAAQLAASRAKAARNHIKGKCAEANISLEILKKLNPNLVCQ